MDNVILKKIGENEIKIIRFGKIVCIKDKKDIEVDIDNDVLRWKDGDGEVALMRKSGFMTLAMPGGPTYQIDKDGELGFTMPE